MNTRAQANLSLALSRTLKEKSHQLNLAGALLYLTNDPSHSLTPLGHLEGQEQRVKNMMSSIHKAQLESGTILLVEAQPTFYINNIVSTSVVPLQFFLPLLKILLHERMQKTMIKWQLPLVHRSVMKFEHVSDSNNLEKSALLITCPSCACESLFSCVVCEECQFSSMCSFKLGSGDAAELLSMHTVFLTSRQV